MTFMKKQFLAFVVAISLCLLTSYAFGKTASCPCNPCPCAPCKCGGGGGNNTKDKSGSGGDKNKTGGDNTASKQHEGDKEHHDGHASNDHHGHDHHGDHHGHGGGSSVGVGISVDLSGVGQRHVENDPFATGGPPVAHTQEKTEKPKSRKTGTTTNPFDDVKLTGRWAKENGSETPND